MRETINRAESNSCDSQQTASTVLSAAVEGTAAGRADGRSANERGIVCQSPTFLSTVAQNFFTVPQRRVNKKDTFTMRPRFALAKQNRCG
jgi:hypothetical protein